MRVCNDLRKTKTSLLVKRIMMSPKSLINRKQLLIVDVSGKVKVSIQYCTNILCNMELVGCSTKLPRIINNLTKLVHLIEDVGPMQYMERVT